MNRVVSNDMSCLPPKTQAEKIWMKWDEKRHQDMTYDMNRIAKSQITFTIGNKGRTEWTIKNNRDHDLT